MKKKSEHSQPVSGSQDFFNRKDETAFFSKSNAKLQRQALAGTDRIHSPLLDSYSRDSGLPRDQVTQHDPGYEAWLRARSSTATTTLASPALPII